MKKIMYVLAILVVLMAVAGCSNGVSKDELKQKEVSTQFAG